MRVYLSSFFKENFGIEFLKIANISFKWWTFCFCIHVCPKCCNVIVLSAVVVLVVSVLDPRRARSFLAKKGNFCSDASTWREFPIKACWLEKEKSQCGHCIPLWPSVFKTGKFNCHDSFCPHPNSKQSKCLKVIEKGIGQRPKKGQNTKLWLERIVRLCYDDFIN